MIETAIKPASQSVEFLRKTSRTVPVAAVVLGSGVKVLEGLLDEVSLPYEQVFGIAPTIAGHAGSLTLGRVGRSLIAVMRGRFHLYEGHDWNVVTLPARVMVEWGVPNLYLTNAAGGLNPGFQVGDLMLISGYRDHLNPQLKETGLLPALAKAPTYCANELAEHIWQVGQKLAASDSSFRQLRRGNYAGLLGPSYETLAEISMLKHLQADAVGMSTIPELLTCVGTKTKAAAISVITNVWKEGADIEGHEEVLRAAKAASERLDKLFRAAVVD